jgi:ornithine cyclodeaminase
MKQKKEVLWLSQEEVVAAGGLDMEATMVTLEQVFRLHGTGDCVLPNKIVLEWDMGASEESGMKKDHINFMPAYIGGRINALGIKGVASFPRNPFEFGLPRGSALIVLYDTQVGVPQAVMDGTLISAMRTGAATGVATKYLSREKVTRVGLIGAGVQCRTQLMGVQVARPGIRQVKIFDISQDRSQAFAEEMEARLGLEIQVANSAEEVIRWAEILITATTTNHPIVKQGWLAPGTFYALVSGNECEYDVIRNVDKVYVDDWEYVKHRMASSLAHMWRDGELTDEDIFAELSQVVIGRKPGRENDDETILFNPVGLGLHDVSVGKRIYESALKADLGQRVILWEKPLWV